MAGHPLRPATDQSLGEPLPRQQANRPRAPPPTPLRALIPAAEATGMSCGISPPFGGLSPFGGQVTHVLRTRAPCADLLYCYSRLRTRLACVKHAASVRSEPGSNSRLKPVAWRKKMLPDETSESQPTKQIIVARFTQTICARKGQMVRTDSGTSYRLSKSDKPPCPAERQPNNLGSIRTPHFLVNHTFYVFHSSPQPPLLAPLFSRFASQTSHKPRPRQRLHRASRKTHLPHFG